jgi:hypothetical protein
VTAFSCKNGLVYSTATSAYAFSAYSSPVTLTGVTTDFTDPAHQSISTGNGGTAYVSWDAQNLYYGLNAAAPFASGDVVELYVGTSAGGTSTGSTGSLPSGTNALYRFWWNAAGGSAANGVDVYNGSAWVPAPNLPFNVKYNGGTSSFVEFSIPRSDLSQLVNADAHLYGDRVHGGTPDYVWAGFQRELLNEAYYPNDTNSLNAN